jgi:polyhydroxyalkanoate synthase
MPEQPQKLSTDTTLSVQQSMLGLPGRDLLDTLKLLLLQGLRQPMTSSHHLLQLSAQLLQVLLGRSTLQADPQDRRFSDPTWRHNPLYRRALQAYLAWQQQLHAWLDDNSLSDDDRARAHFVLRLLGDALAPSNSPLNPQAIKELLDTGGHSLLKGACQLLADLRDNHGLPRQVDEQAFSVGGNLACTPGQVVWRNEQLELIQYHPQQARQYQRPLLIVPPQINKYYIFDLSPHNSLVRYALQQGIAVFMISWRNPHPAHREWGMDDYVAALAQALEVCRDICQQQPVNLMGACAGGLCMALLQGYLQQRRQLRRVASATYLVTLLDSQLDNPLSLFASEAALQEAKRRSYLEGVMDGKEMARVFAWMRPNDLIWHYWVNNYLLGRRPPEFDILYWNSDNTRLPAALHGELLDFFQYNPLRNAGTLQVCGKAIDLRKVRLDSFSVAGISDHITPWQAVHRSGLLLGGQQHFVLANNGHIQSILNPPDNTRGWFYSAAHRAASPEDWQSTATRQPGSWWPEWMSWLQARSGELQDSPEQLGNAEYPPLQAAPGSYVHVR